ncbi:flagellar motor switch protein FliG [Desulfolucanica intricata]|uniref:flagellar motor switch protein FliG n=1 Tax=Desulfolucanica intricata TaxID=1285191 RepID=UPI00082E22E5|nr:flagellar motor switch protein FliG [Desulfolucanica intricata]
MRRKKLSGLQKSAILLITLGADLSSNILKQDFYDEDIERLSFEISNMDKISPDTRQVVLREFAELHQAREYLMQGGIKYAQDLLEKTLGPQKAAEIIKRLARKIKSMPFSSLQKIDPRHLMSFIQDEHPQTIALILVYLDPEQASVILSSLPAEKQSDIARRIATMDRASPEVVKEVERVLEYKMSTVMGQENTEIGGVSALVNILNMVDRSTERTILENLEAKYPVLAEEVRNRMFVFEDIVKLDDIAIQRILRDINPKDLPIALRGANEEVLAKIFRNQSRRAADMLKEEIKYIGPVRLKDVEEAQKKIVNVIRSLEEVGEISISRGNEDAIVI